MPRTLAQKIQDLQRGIPMDAAETLGAQAPSGPDLPGPLPQAQADSPFQPAPRPKLSDIIQGKLDQASAPPTKKGALLKAIMEGGAIGLGGLLGGTAGAYGAGQGTEQFNTAQTAQNTEKRKELQTQLEAEKNREERNVERSMTVQQRADQAKATEALLGEQRRIEQERINAENERAANVQKGENARLAQTLANKPLPRIDPLSPEGQAAQVQFQTQLSKLPTRPVSPPPLLPPENEAQRIRISQASRPERPDQTVVQTVDDPANPGKQKLVVVDKNTLTSKDISGAAAKTTAGQQNATAKSETALKEGTQSLAALRKLAAQKSYAADQAMADQFFNIIKPGSGARMNEANIKRLLTPGPLADKLTVLAQKLQGGQPLDDAARQQIISAAEAVIEARGGGAAAGSPIVQRNKSTGLYRYSTDGGKTWQAGQPK